jgi:hypothetical protein
MWLQTGKRACGELQTSRNLVGYINRLATDGSGADVARLRSDTACSAMHRIARESASANLAIVFVSAGGPPR